MKCFIQLFELSLSVESKAFDDILSGAYSRAMKKDRYMEETDYGHLDESLVKKGLSVAYHDDKKKKKIRLIVNPDLITSNDDLEKQISFYFHRDYELDDFKLSRVVIAADIDIGSSTKASDYIKLLYNIGRVKCFSPLKRDKDNDNEKINKERCFALKGNSNGVEFWAYQLMEHKCVLRFEVRLTKPDTIRAYSGDTDTPKRIKALAKNCDPIFMDTFRYIVPPGEHYKKPKAEKLVRERVSDAAMRRRMLQLMTLIKEQKSLHLGLKALNFREFRDVMLAFEEINISPITISKRHDVKRLESLYSYLDYSK